MLLAIANQSLSNNTLNDEITDAFNTIIPFDEASKDQLNKQLEQYHDAEVKIEFCRCFLDCNLM